MILHAQDRRHAIWVTSGIVNIAHQRIASHRDMRATFNGSALRCERAVPQRGKSKNLAIGKVNEEWLLAGICADMPLIEPRGNLDAALAALPGTAVARRSGDALHARVNRRKLRCNTLGEERHEAPAQHHTLANALGRTHDGHLLGRRHVVTRLEAPAWLDDREGVLDRRLILGYISATHENAGAY